MAGQTASHPSLRPALQPALQALRDPLPPEEAVHIGVQLSTLIRGAYYDGWKIAGKPLKLKTREELFSHVEKIHNVPPAGGG